jgi:hypothetical protein
MYYLSFDVANKSLATSFVYYDNNYKCLFKDSYLNDNTNINNNINNIYNNLKETNNKLNNIIEYLYFNVEDLIPGKKVKDTDIIERSKSLKKYMSDLKLIINKTISEKNVTRIYVLIEYQLSSNYNANAIYNQIIYEFSNSYPGDEYIYEIIVMNPSYKNKIYFNKELKHSSFIQKYTNNYVANKNHCKANFLYFLNSFNMKEVLKNIKSKNIDDLADSFMQIFAYIKYIK